MTLRSLLLSDLARYDAVPRRAGAPPRRRLRARLETILFRAGWHATVLYRLAHWCGLHGAVLLALAVCRVNLMLTGADIEFSASIGPGLLVVHPVGVVIGRGTTIGANATIFQGVTFGIRGWAPDELDRYPAVGDGCTFFARCSVVGPVRVGRGATVGAHALVLADVPAGTTAVGVPAQVRPAPAALQEVHRTCA
ncbi:MAG: serine O-acetyltransferase [Vicinamibacterales bacterium]